MSANTEKRAFLVQTLGYWGRGRTVSEAAKNCLLAGAPRNARVIVDLIVGDDAPEITHGGMILRMDEEARLIPVCKGVRLSFALKMWV